MGFHTNDKTTFAIVLWRNYFHEKRLACEEARGEDRKKFGVRETEKFGKRSVASFGITGSLIAGFETT